MGAACARRGVDPAVLEAALAGVGREQGGLPARVGTWPPALLIDYIEAEHHGYVRENLPVLRAFAKKVAQVHGPAQPELPVIADRVEALAAALEAHLAAEEEDVFPRIKALVDTRPAALRPLLVSLEQEHDEAGGLMGEIRRLSADYTPPEWACNTYRALFAKLEEFEEDLHRHVHLENNVLFPRVRALAEEPA